MRPQVQEVYLESSPKKLFFLVHGHAGSPDDFNELPEYLRSVYGASVQVMLLPGHGTHISDLDNLGFEDFLSAVDKRLKSALEKYDEVVVGGLCFGAQLAMILASRYQLKGVFDISAPYQFKFPFNIPGGHYLRFFKKYWTRYPSPRELELRVGTVRYDKMHINGIKVVNDANCAIEKIISKINCPILTIHSTDDPISHHKGVDLLAKTKSVYRHKKIFDNKIHNILFTDLRKNTHQEIGKFFCSAVRLRKS